jgi:hypothetical protein
MVTKEFFSRSRRVAETVLLWKQAIVHQRRLMTTALSGLAPICPFRASPPTPRKSSTAYT